MYKNIPIKYLKEKRTLLLREINALNTQKDNIQYELEIKNVILESLDEEIEQREPLVQAINIE